MEERSYDLTILICTKHFALGQCLRTQPQGQSLSNQCSGEAERPTAGRRARCRMAGHGREGVWSVLYVTPPQGEPHLQHVFRWGRPDGSATGKTQAELA
jgi:hypothetical protein